MAQIDLKNATIWFRDGYIGPGENTFLVNNGGGYMSGVTTIAVNGDTGSIADGDLFTIEGDVDTGGRLIKHTVTSASDTLGNTTSITFTPATENAVSDDAEIVILPHELEINIGEGNLTWTEKKNMEYKLNRGLLDTVREGDQAPVELKVDALWEFIRGSSGDPPTPVDFVKKRGSAADYVSSSDDACEPFGIDIDIEYIPPCGGEEYEKIHFSDFRYEQIDFDLRAGTIAFSGKCNTTEAEATRY